MLLLAREMGLLRLGTVSIDGTKIDANASKIRSLRYDRAQALREKLAADIAELTAKAEAADAEDIEGSQLILATNMATTPSDQPTFAATILAMEKTVGLPRAVLADAGFASGAAVAELEARHIEPLVAIARTQPHRPYDFRPPPEPKPERRIAEPWRLAMKAKLETEGKQPMRLQVASMVRSSALRKRVLSLAKTCSIGLRSGE